MCQNEAHDTLLERYQTKEHSGIGIQARQMTYDYQKCRKQTPKDWGGGGGGGELAIPTSGSHIWSYEQQNQAHEGSMEI
jgi:hypothetical protein